jgi:hypothetical protein
MVSRIGQRLTAAVSDRKVTPEEAQQIVAEAKLEKKWTPQLQNQLKTFVSKHAAQLDPQARQVLDGFIASARPKTDLHDPALLKADRTSVSWTPVGPDAKLYVDTVSADDVAQGYIGDCYLASGISSIAAANPDIIKKAITDNGDGTYSVRFFDGVGEGGRPKAVTVTVDDDVAMGSRGPQYASARDSKELWPGLLEKAYAKWKGGYEKVGNGGSASDLFQALSGKQADWATITDLKPDALFKKIQTQTAAHHPVAAGTYAEDSPKANYTNTGVHGDHFYTVLGATEENGKKYVQLRNPWGFSEPANNGPDDGIFKLPLADFVKLYENIEFGG